MRVAYFAHDLHDATVAKRVAALQRDGHEVTGYMMRRGPLTDVSWPVIDLGETANAAYLQRLAAIFKGARKAQAQPQALRAADVVIARNLDMLACASLVLRDEGLHTPLIYECLDIHHMLTGNGPVALALRGLEGRLLQRTALVIVSSPAFESDYFARYHPGKAPVRLLENRLAGAVPPRPGKPVTPAHGKLRIGWFGVLRCPRSLHLLTGLARENPSAVEIVIAGKPVVPGFEHTVSGLDNVRMLGPYKAPDDLPGLYGNVDAVWAADFYQPAFNSRALLPNRLYEGGWFGVPAIAPADTQTGSWVAHHDSGFLVEEPVEDCLPVLATDLLADPGMLTAASARLLALPESVFAEPAGTMDALLTAAGLRPARRGAA